MSSASASASNSSFVHPRACAFEMAVDDDDDDDEDEEEGREEEGCEEDEEEDKEERAARGRPAQSNSQSSALSVAGPGSIADDDDDDAPKAGWTSRKDEAVGSAEADEVVAEWEESRDGSAQRRTCMYVGISWISQREERDGIGTGGMRREKREKRETYHQPETRPTPRVREQVLHRVRGCACPATRCVALPLVFFFFFFFFHHDPFISSFTLIPTRTRTRGRWRS